MASIFGNSLDQIGQGYANPPQGSFSGMSPFWQNSVPQILQNQAFASLRQAGGGPQNSNYAGIFPGSDAMGHPANPPATGDNQFGGAPPSQPPPNPPAGGGFPSQFPPNPPASGGPFGYGQQPPAIGNALNAGGFGGLGAMFAGQRPGLGARYWARLNNIGGS